VSETKLYGQMAIGFVSHQLTHQMRVVSLSELHS